MGGSKGPGTTYLTKEEIERVGHVTDPLGSFTDESGATKFFMIPIVLRNRNVKQSLTSEIVDKEVTRASNA